MKLLLAVILVWVSGLSVALAEPVPQPPIEAYGEQPFIRSLSLSPSGEKVAFILRIDGRDVLSTFTDGADLEFIADVSDVQTGRTWFVNEDTVILRASMATGVFGYKGRFNYGAAFSVDLNSKKINQLLRGTKELYPAQGGLGRIVGIVDNGNTVLMPAYTGHSSRDVGKSVFQVKLGRRRGRRFTRSTIHATDWIFDADGTLLAEEIMHEDRNEFSIKSAFNGKPRTLLKVTDVQRAPYSLVGVLADGSALILSDRSYDKEEIFVALDFDGNLEPIDLTAKDAGIDSVIIDETRRIHGMRYSGMLPSYSFLDPELDTAMDRLMTTFPSTHISLIDWNRDLSIWLVYIFDGTNAGQYYKFNVKTNKLALISLSRENIPAEAVGQVVGIEYKARDGLTIPAIVTWPAGVADADRTDLPLIVMPHGGPRTYDQVDFDWIAQYFANRGYAVLQPNFRGSTGFSTEFMLAGNGEWGGKMQDDISDGLAALVNDGYIDPDKVCIVGWSYGGYAALAGGAFTPDLYKCVVAIAPVTDLSRWLTDKKRDKSGRESTFYYWEELIGDREEDKAKNKARSPINSAGAFQAPVLLVHGRDDFIVPIHHSERMEKALKKAGKQVKLIKVKKDGHSLLDSENRVEALREVADFVETHIGAQAAQ